MIGLDTNVVIRYLAQDNAAQAVAAGADFADALIGELGDEDRCTYTATFDRAAVRHADLHLLET